MQLSSFTKAASFFPLEVENYVMDKFTINRDSARGYGSINFNTGDNFKIYFCLREESVVNLNNVRYSNDGGSDVMEFSIDGIRLGILTSSPKSNQGFGWNNFIATGVIGPNLTLPSGRHFVSVHVNSSDLYGIEIDQLELRTSDIYLSDEIFKCTLFCDEKITYSNGDARHDMPSATLSRRTLPLVCSTNKNLIFPVFHQSADMFLVTVMHPKYRSFENNFNERIDYCDLNNKIMWEVSKVEISSSYKIWNYSLYPGLELECGVSNVSRASYVKVKFTISKHKESGTRLVIKLLSVVDMFHITAEYKVDGIVSTLKNAYFSPQQTKREWILPAGTWSDSNEISFNVLHDPLDTQPILIDYIKLELNSQTTQATHLLHSSYDTRITLSTDDAVGSSIIVRNVADGKTYSAVSNLLISTRLPWANIYSPIASLSRSGELKLLPRAPHALTKIPFGTSLLIGQHNPADELPSAPIKTIDVNPASLLLKVTFEDNSTKSIMIKSTWRDTKLIFKDIVDKKDRNKYPLLSVLTMWNYDGFADADRVSTNGDIIHHVAKGWNQLYGTSFTFFRQCLSKHNTQSPDLRLQFINTKDLYLFL